MNFKDQVILNNEMFKFYKLNSNFVNKKKSCAINN